MITLSKKKLYYFFFNIFFFLTGYIFLSVFYQIKYDMWLKLLITFVLTNIVMNIACIVICGLGVISPISFFNIIIYLFHFGQAILTCFIPDYISASTNFVKNGTNEVKQCLMYCYLTVQLIVLFSILFYKKNKPVDKVWGISTELNEKQYRFAAVILLCITAPCRFIYDITRIMIMNTTGDYFQTFNAGLPSVLMYLADFYIIAVVMLLVSFRNNKKISKIITILVVVGFVFSMFSGNRMYAVVSLYIFLYIYFTKVGKISLKNAFLLIFILYLGLQFITIISNIRTEGITIESILNYRRVSNTNVLINILDEFGSTIYSVRQTMVEVPENISYECGASYLKAISFIVPDIGGAFSEIHEDVNYTLRLTRRYTYGGSIIGELFYNFGYLGFLFTPIIGYVIAGITQKFNNLLTSEQYSKMTIYIMPLYGVIVWVRDYFSVLIREPVWAGAIIYVLYKLSKKVRIL